MASTEACVAARSGDLKSALQLMATLSIVQGNTTVFSANLMNAYLLALDGASSRAQAAFIELRKLASPRHPETHPVHQTMENINALTGAPDNDAREQRMAKPLTVLEASTGRRARLPLAPNWFAFYP